jgi:integrase/recombinase XerD
MTDLEVARLRAEYLLPYRQGTREGYALSLNVWFDWCRRESLAPLEVRRIDLDRYIQHLIARGRMPATVRFRLAPVRGFYRFACLEGALPRDPAALVRLPRPDPSPNTARCLDRREMRAFLDLGDRRGGMYQAIAYLL